MAKSKRKQKRSRMTTTTTTKTVRTVIQNPLRIGKTDKAVIRAFTEKRAADGHKLTTDGTNLSGYWMGGNVLGYWKDHKIHLPDTGSRSGQTVQNAVRREAPKNDLFNGRGWNPGGQRVSVAVPGGRESGTLTRHGRNSITVKLDSGRSVTLKEWPGQHAGQGVYQHPDYPGHFIRVYEANPAPRYRIESDEATRAERDKIYTDPDQAHRDADRIRRRGPSAFADVQVDYGEGVWEHHEQRNPMACGDLSDKRCDQLNDVYDSALAHGYSKRRAAQQARGVVRKQVARDKRKRSRRHNPRGKLIRVPGGFLRKGMIVKAPEYVSDFFRDDEPKVRWQDWPAYARASAEHQGQDFPDPMPKRLRVDYWGEGTADPDGESDLAAIDASGRELGVSFDWNTGAYPPIWLVEADSIDDLDAAARKQGQYPPDYEDNPMKNSDYAPFDRVPSTKKLAEAFRLDTATAKKLHAVLQGDEDTIDDVLGPSNTLSYQSGRMPARSLAMRAADKLLEMHGVEDAGVPSPHNFSYLNSGDMYAATLLFRGRRVWIDTWSDEIERLERRGIRRGYDESGYEENSSRQQNPAPASSRAASLSRRIGSA